jgi:hypothetical protein
VTTITTTATNQNSTRNATTQVLSPVAISVSTALTITIAGGATTIGELETTIRQTLATVLGVDENRISITISMSSSFGTSSSSSSLSYLPSSHHSVLSSPPQLLASSQPANVTITFKPETTNSTDAMTSDDDDVAWQSARSLAMLFADQIKDTNSTVSQALRALGVMISTDSLRYLPMYACNDGTTASACNDWIITDPITNNNNNDDDEKPSIATWYDNISCFVSV